MRLGIANLKRSLLHVASVAIGGLMAVQLATGTAKAETKVEALEQKPDGSWYRK